jgi:Mg2+ and Co2+ transporter CorA
MILNTIEIESIQKAILRATKWNHNSYCWEEEWDWIDSELLIADKKIKEQQEEISRLSIAYQNASDQRAFYVEKCLMLSEVVLELFDLTDQARRNYMCEENAVYARDLYGKHKDLIEELKRNLEVKSE